MDEVVTATNAGNLVVHSAGTLLASGNLVVAALLFLVSVLMVASAILLKMCVVFYRDSKESNRLLLEIQTRTLDAINKLETAIYASIGNNRNSGG